jgi:hypothetical protein
MRALNDVHEKYKWLEHALTLSLSRAVCALLMFSIRLFRTCLGLVNTPLSRVQDRDSMTPEVPPDLMLSSPCALFLLLALLASSPLLPKLLRTNAPLLLPPTKAQVREG